MTDLLAPQFAAARYAKGKVAVRCSSDGSGTKTRAMRLASALRGRWVSREKAYIMSPASAEKLRTAYESGRDAILGDVRGVLDWVLT